MPELDPFRTLLTCAALAAAANAGVVHVDPSATGAGNGSSWTDAYTDLRPALDAAQPGDELWVAAALYVPGPTATEADTFRLKSGVALYGGFAGHETQRSQRDWLAHPTILSGDVGRDDLPGNIVTANSAHVVTGSGVDASAVLDGFVIEAGHTGPAGTPAGSSEMFGSGMYNVAGSPTVANCTFRRNVSAFASGGAVYNWDSSPSFTHCSFEDNHAHLAQGAGMFNGGASVPTIEDCSFVGNVATTGAGGSEGQGAALSFWKTPAQVVRGSSFVSNHARQFYAAGGIELARGGAISAFLSGLVTVEDCEFRGNRANAGGAISVWGPMRVVDCTFQDNEAYKTTIQSISVGGQGGALLDNSGKNATVEVVGSTFHGNRSGEAAVWCSLAEAPTILSGCILWGNTASGAGLSLREAQFKQKAIVSHCCVAGLFQQIPGEPPPTTTLYPGCIDTDPRLANPSAFDLRLSPTSPCLDAGSNAAVAGVLTDLDGNRRVVAALGGAPLVDMGPFEYGSAPPPACPAVHTQPASTSAATGTVAKLFVGVDAVGPVSYQWRKNGVALSDGGNLSGANTAALTWNPLGPGDGGSYDCVVANACGGLTSAPAVLTVVKDTPVMLYCFGDGSGTQCPCGNNVKPGEELGCLNSSGEGGQLEGGGLASVSNDSFTLDGSGMGQSTCLYLQGETRRNGGDGAVFGSGLLCVAGKIVRMGAKANAGGSSTFPDTGDPAISVAGHVPPGATRTYQVWYRDTQSPCTGKNFNLTNAVEVTWLP